MEQPIIVDSCCDMTDHLRRRLGVVSVPLTMTLGSKEYIDDDELDLPRFMEDMAACKERVGSASPSPALYQERFEALDTAYAVTLSSKLSGSYASAHMGKQFAKENGKGDIHIFDSKSASAGEVLVTMKLRELLDFGHTKDKIISTLTSFIDSMKTYFVLDRYDNLQKNGRLNKITGKIIQAFGIKLVMGANDGDIGLFAKVRGLGQALERMLRLIEDSGKETEGESLVLSHCNNEEVAAELADSIKSRFSFREVLVVPTGGLSSLYADNKGIVMAF